MAIRVAIVRIDCARSVSFVRITLSFPVAWTWAFDFFILRKRDDIKLYLLTSVKRDYQFYMLQFFSKIRLLILHANACKARVKANRKFFCG